jgi:hypothetical protein
VDTNHTVSWTSKAEAAILSLRDIEAVSIQAEGEEVREVHILTTSSRPAKQIVRDVQTLLQTRFNRAIDHRVVSVAFQAAERAAGAAPEPRRPAAPALPAPERVRFVSANLFVSGPRVQAQVELKWRGIPRMGSASGWSTRDGANRLIVSATLAAVQEYLEDQIALSLEGVEVVRLGRREVAVVALALLAHREQKTLVGCSTVEQDSQQAVVLATLAALNRVVGGLPSREPSEFGLRPAST